MNEIRFDGRVAIVTGAGTGMGRQYALDLASRGAMVVVNDCGCDRHGEGSSESVANRVADEIRLLGGKAVAVFGDVSDASTGKALVETALDTFGSVDILVNNAGIILDHSFLKTTESEWDRIVGVHLKGAFLVTQPAFSVMRERGYGRIIMTTSGAGLYGNFGQANYGAAKMGLIGLMNVLELEGNRYNICINAIAPLATTRMTADLIQGKFAELMKPSCVTALGLYLVSEENNQTGCIYNAAGGWYSRTEIICGSGTIIGDGTGPVSPEDVKKNFGKINSLKGGKPLSCLQDSFLFVDPVFK
ncbi:MAG: SDR family NAD(P)-dependent oxidoreductase [Spirochaetes bacterium]|nr:SDR family NAD(P)-dependent oxidoreductase [Spirochaetota bacterium]